MGSAQPNLVLRLKLANGINVLKYFDGSVLSDKQKMEQRLIILLTLLCVVSSGIVKRDTIEDLEDIGNSIVNSVKDVVGMDEDRGIIEDMKIEAESFCISDSQCRPEVLQFCDKTKKLYGTCTFHTWVWIALASVFAFVFCSCFTSLLCCCCFRR